MNNVRRLGLFATVFFVVLRISIGWQFLYEGLWKLDTQSSNNPWSAEGYLKNAQGPLREQFFELAGDGPYELNWLDYTRMAWRWDKWRERFENHYPGLSDNQKARLNRIINGSKAYYAALSALPEGVDLSPMKKAISYDADKKRLVVDGKWHLTPVEREKLYRMVPDVSRSGGKLVGGTELEREFYDAVTKVYDRQSRLGYKEKLAASLRGDADRVGAIYGSQKKKVDPQDPVLTAFNTYGEIDKYRAMVKEYEAALAARSTDFDQEHLNYTWGELQAMKAKLVGPVKALEAEMKLAARDILSPRQLAAGPVPPRWTSLTVSNYLTIAGLIGLGVLLIVGLFTRFAAFAGAFMVLSFYLVYPPWPGIPPAPGPEHALIVNKNLIEVIALLAIAFSQSGYWFGLDAVARRFFRRKKQAEQPKLVKPGKGPIPIASAS